MALTPENPLIRASILVERQRQRIHDMLGGMAVQRMVERLHSGRSVTGAPLKPLSPLTRNLIVHRYVAQRAGAGRTRRGGGTPLINTGGLIKSLAWRAEPAYAHVYVSGAFHRMIGAVHEYGAVIRPRRAPVLMLGYLRRGGKLKAVVAKRVKVPGRRWFGLTDADMQAMVEELRKVIVRVWTGGTL